MPRTRRLLLSVLACLTACTPEAIVKNDDCTFDGDLSPGVQGTLSPYNILPLPEVHAPGASVPVRVRLLGLVVNGLEVGGVCGAQVRWTPGPGSGTVQAGTTQTSGGGLLDEGVAGNTWTLPNVTGVTATLTAEVINSDPLLQVVFTASTTPPAAGFALSLTQPALTIAQGASTPTTTVNIARTNFTGGVTLSVLNLPTGVTASFAPVNPITGNSSVLTLTVPLATPVGVYNTLAVQGVGSTGTVTTPLALTVAAAPAPVGLTLAILAGNNQSALVNRTVEIHPSVIVRNSSGQGVPGISVTWQVVQGTGSFLVDAPTTDATGTSRLTYFGPTTAGTIKLRATANSVQQVSPPFVDFTITGLAP